MSDPEKPAEPIVDVPVVPTEPVAPVAEPLVAHTETPTLLGELKSPEAPAPVVETPASVEVVAEPAADDPANPVADKPAEPAAAVEPAALEPIVYPEWKLPEGVQPDKAALAQYSDILAQHRVSPEVGQALLDQHTAAMQQFKQAYADQTSRDQHRVFGETRAEWVKQVLADPEIGGAGHQTAMGAIARVRDVLASSARPGTPQYEKDMTELNTALAVTGMGDHPVLLKLLHRAARFIDEPGMGPVGIKPPPDPGSKPKSLRDIYKQNTEARNGQ
jgi:hypothetical protein